MGEAETSARVMRAPSRSDPEVQRFLAESLGRIIARFNPQAMVLFGSRVDGTPDEWSDIDLVIVSSEFEGMRVLPRMALFRRTAQPHIHVDALCYTPSEFEYMMTQPSMVREAVETGLRVI